MYHDTTLYESWYEQMHGTDADYVPFSGDFQDLNDVDGVVRFYVVNGNSGNQVDSVKLWLKDADGNLLAETNRGHKLKWNGAAKFQVPWEEGYQLDIRISWVKYADKKTWKNVYDGVDGNGWYSSGYYDGGYYQSEKLENCK